MQEKIKIYGARENNLKNISLEIPKNRLVVLTGLSGSGKSTLAFDTLQRECQRLYMESLGMATDLLPKAKVEKIEGLSPSISIDQHHGNMNPRSTIGTITDLFTLLRVLFSKLGQRTCPVCKNSFTQMEVESEEKADTITCPDCQAEMPIMTKRDFSFNTPEGACPVCKGLGVINQPDLSLLFDYNKSIQAGGILGWDEVYINRYGQSMVNAGKHYGFSFDIDMPIKDYDDIQRALLLYGAESPQFVKLFPEIKPPKTVPAGKFEGVVTNFMRRYAEKQNGAEKMEKLMISKSCPSCQGAKLKEESRAVTIAQKNIIEISSMSLEELQKWIKSLLAHIPNECAEMTAPIFQMMLEKLGHLTDIGVGYLSLDRSASSLSAGEMQRIRLASLLGTGLTGVLYVLDEPTTGLHSSDNGKLLEILKAIRDMGNTILVVEHDPEFIEAADYVIDMGPGAGKHGGEIIAAGTPKQIAVNESSVTGRYLFYSWQKGSVNRRSGSHKTICISGACKNNLKHITVEIPAGKLVSITGVSGAGKSSLLFDVLYEYCQHGDPNHVLCQEITGLEEFKEVLIIDQSPIGRTSRSNAATYTDIFSHIRNLYAELNQAKALKLKAKDFSFNVAGGRCEKCEGVGVLSVPMHFMPEIEVTCPNCYGKRFQKHILEIRYKGYSISDVLYMSIEEACSVFADQNAIAERLNLLKEVGLGYLSLGQPASTLSGGEAQRIKLAKELGKSATGKTLYLLDEPTTGLHAEDVGRLIKLLNRIVDQGHTVIAIEHNINFIYSSDWLIDLGIGGGLSGGEIVGTGTPEEIMQKPASLTGCCLKRKY